MEENRTNKELLVKGLQTIGICLVLMFLGPTLLHLALTNQDKPTFILVLIIAIIVCALALFFLYRGIQIILDSIFKK
uniref:DUF6095 family protein n=1 Tax=Gelidibacter sp. TaxID=2018083 RepID=UPI00404A7485